MLAVGLTASSKEIQSFEIEAPTISAPDDVLVRIVQAGIDGTDRAVVQFYKYDPPPGEDRIVMGHEAVGVVEEVGSAVTDLKPGDVVVPTVRRSCGLCASCKNGESDTCSTGLFTERGLHKRHGYYTEKIVEKPEYLVKVPRELAHLAVLIEPVSIAEKGIQLIRHIQARLPWTCSHSTHKYVDEHWADCKKALVIGAGPLGILFTALLRLHGVVTYVAINRPDTDPRVRLIHDLNAIYFDSNNTPMQDVHNKLGPFDIIVESSGASHYAMDLITAMARNGIYVMTGIPSKDREVCMNGDLMIRQLVRYNQIVAGSVNSNRAHFEQAVEDLRALNELYPVQISSLISERYALTDHVRAFSEKKESSIKPIFEIGEF